MKYVQKGQDTDLSSGYMISSGDDAWKLRDAGITISLPKGTCIYAADSIPTHCYLLLRGQVKVCENTFGGSERVYNVLYPGALLMELSILFQQKLPINFITITETEMVQISREDLIDAIYRDGDYAMEILLSLRNKFTSVMEQLRQSNSHCAEWKVCNLLLTYAERHSVEYYGKTLITERITQQLMADLLRLNRMTIAKCLNNLKDNGLIEQINSNYCIRDIEKLKRHMAYLDDVL